MSSLTFNHALVRERLGTGSRLGSRSMPSDEVRDAAYSEDIHVLSYVALLGVKFQLRNEAQKILDFLLTVLVEPEFVLTAVALTSVQMQRFEEAEIDLQRVLERKPEFDPARVALAGLWLMQNKPGWRQVLEAVTATSLDPVVRTASCAMLESARKAGVL